MRVKHMYRTILFILLPSFVSVMCMRQADDTDVAKSHQLPDNKKLGSILNNDIDNILHASSGSKITAREYKESVLHLLNAKPGVLAQNVGMPDPVIYRSQVATSWDKHYGQVLKAVFNGEDERMGPAIKRLRELDTDALMLTIEVCRQRGVLIVASYRMNAEDFYDGELDMYDFGRTHKHLRIPGANCLDPAYLDVFKHRMEIFTEVANQYDIDGIEFDFRRWNHMISNPHQNYSVLTQMVSETREMLDEVARKKGRERLLLGVRVGPMIEGQPLDDVNLSCQDLGLDVITWVKEGLVDYMCPTYFWGHNPGDDPETAEFVDLAKGTPVGIYPTVFPYSKWQTEDPEAGRIDPDEKDDLQRYKNDIIRAALHCYAQGADGISTFNWVPHQQPEMVNHPLRPGWGIGSKKVQMILHAKLSSPQALREYLEVEDPLSEEH